MHISTFSYLLLFFLSYLKTDIALLSHVFFALSLFPFGAIAFFTLPLCLTPSLTPRFTFSSGLPLYKTMRAIPLSIEGERTLSTMLWGLALSGNQCRFDGGSGAGISIKYSYCACETTQSRLGPFSACVHVLTLITHDSFCRSDVCMR